MRSRRGATLTELLVVLTMIGILANVGLPMVRGAVVKADAAHVIGDFHTIEVAVYNLATDGGAFPRSAGWNRVPSELREHLPAGFSFGHKDIRYRWRRWNALGSEDPMIGLQVQTDNPELHDALQHQFRGSLALVTRNRMTLMMN